MNQHLSWEEIHRLKQQAAAAEQHEAAELEQTWSRRLDDPEVSEALASVARRDVVQPDSQLRAMVEYRRWHCPGCDREFDTYAVDVCPHCGADLSLPF